ncbi:MAG: protein kinase [Cyanobacteria bacterium]|nr:protein kinase [Cyanobacteriota bacterium]
MIEAQHEQANQEPGDLGTGTRSAYTCEGSPDPLSIMGKVLLDRYKITDAVERTDRLLVYQAVDLSSNHLVMMTTPRSDKVESFEQFANQSRVNFQLQHQNIEVPLALESDPAQFCRPFLVTDYQSTVSLIDLIETQRYIEIEEEIVYVLTQICDALAYAHSKKISHGNLNPHNITFREKDGTIRAMLGDFGLGERLDEKDAFRLDLYRLGVLAYFMITGNPPFEGQALDESLKKLPARGNRPVMLAYYRPELFCADELGQLLEEAMISDEDWQLGSISDFKEGIEEWSRSVEEAKSHQSELADEIRQEEIAPRRMAKPIKQSVDIKTTINNIVKLRTAEINQAETLAIMFTDRFAESGARKSPRKTALRLLVRCSLGALMVAAVGYIAVAKPKELQDVWESASERVSTAILKDSPREEPIWLDENPEPLPSHTKAGKKKVVLPPVPQKIPPRAFSSDEIHDFYRGTASQFTNNESKRKRHFRVEFRQFKKEWIE